MGEGLGQHFVGIVEAVGVGLELGEDGLELERVAGDDLIAVAAILLEIMAMSLGPPWMRSRTTILRVSTGSF